jgi:hypothetical protein
MDYRELKQILQILIFGEASICPVKEKKMIAGVFMNQLSYPIHYFDNDGDDNNDGLPDPRDLAKNFDAWNAPNIHLTTQYDLDKFIECGIIAEEYTELYLRGKKHFSEEAVFYITKKRLSELEAKGKTPQDIFTRYFSVIEVPTPDNFYHKFYKIGDAIN